RYLEKRTLRWVFCAGVSVGLSILAKITGVYLAAAIVVFLAFDAAFDEVTPRDTPTQSAVVALLLLIVMLGFFVSPLLLTVSAHDQNSLNSLMTLGLPAALMAGVVAVLITRRWAAGWRPDLHIVWSLATLTAGAAIVLLLFSIPYLEAGAIGS